MRRTLLFVLVVATVLPAIPADAHTSPKKKNLKVITYWLKKAAPAKLEDAPPQSGKTGINDCPAAESCGAYKLGKARWPLKDGRLTMTYRYNDAGRPSSA